MESLIEVGELVKESVSGRLKVSVRKRERLIANGTHDTHIHTERV